MGISWLSMPDMPISVMPMSDKPGVAGIFVPVGFIPDWASHASAHAELIIIIDFNIDLITG